jgi:hypothetical protein
MKLYWLPAMQVMYKIVLVKSLYAFDFQQKVTEMEHSPMRVNTQVNDAMQAGSAMIVCLSLRNK